MLSARIQYHRYGSGRLPRMRAQSAPTLSSQDTADGTAGHARQPRSCALAPGALPRLPPALRSRVGPSASGLATTTSPIVGLVAASLFVFLAARCSAPPSVTSVPSYRADAKGRPAVPQRTWPIFGGTLSIPIGLISGASICGGHLFAADPRNGTVHDIRLADGVRIN
jgi:hypothetical protein